MHAIAITDRRNMSTLSNTPPVLHGLTAEAAIAFLPGCSHEFDTRLAVQTPDETVLEAIRAPGESPAMHLEILHTKRRSAKDQMLHTLFRSSRRRCSPAISDEAYRVKALADMAGRARVHEACKPAMVGDAIYPDEALWRPASPAWTSSGCSSRRGGTSRPCSLMVKKSTLSRQRHLVASSSPISL